MDDNIDSNLQKKGSFQPSKPMKMSVITEGDEYNSDPDTCQVKYTKKKSQGNIAINPMGSKGS